MSFLLSLLQGLLLLVSYIKNGRAFPEPLAPEREKYFLDKMEDGDKEARDKLIAHNLRLVAHIVKKYETVKTENEDLISIGTIGLIKGINTYSRKKNTRLATYAARCIENEILMHLRSIKKNRNEILLEESIGSDKEGNEITLLDILSTEGDSVDEKVEKNINKDRLYECLRFLPQRERSVIRYRYGLEGEERMTQRKIAGILGISRSYVSRIEKKAVERLSEIFFENKIP
ncbi:MAG: RNA polymerase sporulation sigma factor SigK [Halanaerobiales bacterium]